MSTTTRRREGCDAVLPSSGRSDRRHCSPACRVRAHRLRNGGARLLTPVELDRLAAAVEPARAEVALVAAITQAARTEWRAAAWVLQRRWPERWALPDEAREPYTADLDPR